MGAEGTRRRFASCRFELGPPSFPLVLLEPINVWLTPKGRPNVPQRREKIQFDMKCLGLVILSDFPFFMDERRRDKTNGMFQKRQEAIKTKRPRTQTKLARPLLIAFVCLSAAAQELWR